MGRRSSVCVPVDFVDRAARLSDSVSELAVGLRASEAHSSTTHDEFYESEPPVSGHAFWKTRIDCPWPGKTSVDILAEEMRTNALEGRLQIPI